ncbi:MAG: endopeptidase La, partial [Bdellovibrionales bacterium]|nr:endopeptidase La [Bdellovibrionales bacterium]
MDSKIHIPQTLPLLPVRDAVVFPYMLLSLYIGRDSSKKAIEEALNKSRIIFLSTQKNAEEENLSANSVFKTGTAGIILRMRTMKDGRMKILVQGLSRALIQDIYEKNSHYEVSIQEIQDLETSPVSENSLQLINRVKDSLKTIAALGGPFSPDLLMILDEVNQPGKLADFVTGHFELKVHEMQNILETLDPEKRLSQLQRILNKEVEIIRMQNRIKKMVKNNLSKFPNEPSPLNNQNLSYSNSTDPKAEEVQELIQKVKLAQMPEKAQKEVLKQISRMEKMHPESSEASMIRGYLDWVIELPWNKSTEDNLDLDRARSILEKDHFGLNEVKERILEFLAVRQLKADSQVKGPILCFVGPPGVGKTSLGKSIATAMKRKYYRVALGGVKDEAEIRGHRRTYVGSMPGKIIQALKQVQFNNPILVLDEVDKLGADFRGDPSAAMLEVLDPEQNCSFRDHYLNLNFDLSKVMFIATANLIENIPYALRDRMEIITLSGYTPTEKVEITQKYIVNKEMKNHGINESHISFTEKGIKHLISHYTKEAGLRNLSREVGSLCRKIAKKVVIGDALQQYVITPKKITELLGPAKYLKETQLKESKIGVSTGLAWTQAGGEILYVEAIRISSSTNKGIILTGQLGKVMEESAQAAYSYIRMYAEKVGIAYQWFKKNEIHIHLPAGATPKDGPSAGVTLATTLISLITNTPVRKDIAMTGEIGLQGQVLPVGGIKEKALAALSHGIVNVILPLKNKADIENTTSKDRTLKELREKMNFIFVENLDEVFAIALEKENPQRVREKPDISMAS